MSYTDQQGRRSPASIASVVLVHAVIGYALYAGLTVHFSPRGPDITRAYEVKKPVPPPPVDETPPPTTKSVPRPAVSNDTIVRVPLEPVPDGPVFRPAEGVPTGDPGPVALPPAKSETPNLAHGPIALGSRGGWVTEADYPSAALRAGVEGSVAILVTIGIDGRVQACTVTQSSGNASLDETTCRLYARRARFQPALDEDGHPTVSQRADRVRWQLPAE